MNINETTAPAADHATMAQGAATAGILTDAKGRKLKLREVDPTYALMLAEAAGDASGNRGFMAIASLYLLVDEIDGVPVPFPHTKGDLYAVARMLGSEGVDALGRYMKGGSATDDTDKAKN